MLIKMKELSSTAFDAEDANLLKVEIKKALAKEEKITIDFDSITHYTTLFFFTLVYYFMLDNLVNRSMMRHLL